MKNFFNKRNALFTGMCFLAVVAVYLIGSAIPKIPTIKVLQSANVPITVIGRAPEKKLQEPYLKVIPEVSGPSEAEIKNYLASQSKGYVTLTEKQFMHFSSKTSDPNLLRYLKKRRTYTEFENYINGNSLTEGERLDQGLVLLEKLSDENIHETLILSEIFAARLSIIQMLPISQLERESMINDLDESMALLSEKIRKQSSEAEDSRHNEYRALEQNIILEVAALEEFPLGQTKQDYLEAKLLEARVAIYGD